MPRMGSQLADPAAARVAFGHEIKAIKARVKAEGRDETPDERERLRLLDAYAGEASDQVLTERIKQFGIELGLDRPGRGAGSPGFGEQVVKSLTDGLGRFKELAPSGGAPITVPVNPDPIRQGEPLTGMRQLIPAVPNTSGQFAFLRQTERVNNAAPVAPGNVKPTSRYSTERIDDRVRTIAHLSEPVERQTLGDAPLLSQFLDDELRLGLEMTLERLILHGTGTGEEFTGLANTSGIHVQDWTEDLLTTTRSAVTALEVQGLAGTGWVLNPRDWQRIELSANAQGYTLTQAGEQLPIQRAARRLWGLPVAVSAAQPPGTGWLADWATTQLHIREDAVVHWSENIYRPDALGAGLGASDFTRNMIAFRCEMRAGLAIGRPMAVVELQLAAP